MQGETLKTRMSISQFKKFMTELGETYEIAKQALEEEDNEVSSKLWQKIFGDAFPEADENTSKSENDNDLLYPIFDREHAKIGLMDYSHAQKPKWAMAENQYKVSIEATKTINGEREVFASDSDTIIGEVDLEFKAILDDEINVFDQVQWQIVNTGYDVKDDEIAKRGGFYPSNLGRTGRKESSLYSGTHWVECFVINANRIIARSGKFYVYIENSRTIQKARGYWKQFLKR